MGHTQPAAQSLLGERFDKFIFAGSRKDDFEDTLKFFFRVCHFTNGDQREGNTPDPALFHAPAVGPFQRLFFSEGLRIAAVPNELTVPHCPLLRRIVNGHNGGAHVIQPALLGQVEGIPALCHHAALPITAASGFAHIQRNLVFTGNSGFNVKVRSEHGGGHVAQLCANNVPGTGIQLFFHPVPGELNHASGHILVFIAGVAHDTAQPGAPVAELRDIPLAVKCGLIVVAAGRHVEHIRCFADCLGSLVEVGLQNPHDLEDICGESCNVPKRIAVSFPFRDQLSPYGGNAFCLIEFVVQRHILTSLSRQPGRTSYPNSL